MNNELLQRALKFIDGLSDDELKVRLSKHGFQFGAEGSVSISINIDEFGFAEQIINSVPETKTCFSGPNGAGLIYLAANDNSYALAA